VAVHSGSCTETVCWVTVLLLLYGDCWVTVLLPLYGDCLLSYRSVAPVWRLSAELPFCCSCMDTVELPFCCSCMETVCWVTVLLLLYGYCWITVLLLLYGDCLLNYRSVAPNHFNGKNIADVCFVLFTTILMASVQADYKYTYIHATIHIIKCQHTAFFLFWSYSQVSAACSHT
jgi:hypothetical protein